MLGGEFGYVIGPSVKERGGKKGRGGRKVVLWGMCLEQDVASLTAQCGGMPGPVVYGASLKSEPPRSMTMAMICASV